MSDSLSPWLSEHIISVAETYGAQLTSIPATDKKKKKVQIKEVYTLHLVLFTFITLFIVSNFPT
jgi:hypothetical protein